MRVTGLLLVVIGALALIFYGDAITGVSRSGDGNTFPALMAGSLLTLGLLAITHSVRQSGQH